MLGEKPKFLNEKFNVDNGTIGVELPIYIWYDDYPTHCSPDFRDKPTNSCRAARVEPGTQELGILDWYLKLSKNICLKMLNITIM